MTDTELQAEVERLTAKLNDALTIATLNERRLTGRLAKAEAVVRRIAQYDPRWKGQHVNDAPSRQQLIEMAFDALAAYDAATRSDGGEG